MQYLQPDLTTITPEKTNGLDLYCFANNNPVSVRIGGISGGNSGANYGKLSNSSNILGALGSLVTAFSFFDQSSGYLSGGLDAGLKFIDKIGTSGTNISSYIKGLEVFGIAMIVTGSLISFVEGVYNNYNNPNYTSDDIGWATLMDFGYYTLKGIGTYALSSAIGNIAASVGLTVGGIVGGLYAVAIGITAAAVTYILWEGLDYLYGKIKEWIFE